MIQSTTWGSKSCALFGGQCIHLATPTILTTLSAKATRINFAGDRVTQTDATTNSNNDSSIWQNADFHGGWGFKPDFIGNTAISPAISAMIGNHVGHNKDGIHRHLATGSYGDPTRIQTSNSSGTRFNLNSFILTSNMANSGASPAGWEQADIHASMDSNKKNFAQLFNPENQGFLAPILS